MRRPDDAAGASGSAALATLKTSLAAGLLPPTAPTPPRLRPLRVLHSVGHLSRGGIETWLYQIVRRLAAPRYEHHVLVWTDAEEAFTAEFHAAGVQVHPLPGHTNPWRLLRTFHRLQRSHGPFDILHTHGTQFHGLLMALGRAYGIGTRIAHSHTDIRPVLARATPGYRLYAAIGHAAIRTFATAGRGVSEMAAVSMWGPRWQTDARWQLMRCGVDLDRFAAAAPADVRARLAIPAGRLVVGHVGRFETQKNHGFLVALLAALVARGVDAHLLLIGDGSLRGECESALRRHGLSERVSMIGDCRDVAPLMLGAMDCFVLPSLYEGLPLALVEAQAAGLPCLVSDSVTPEATAHPALVRRLALASGAESWAEAVTRLPPRLNPGDPQLRAMLERSGFSVAGCAARLDEMYQTATRGWQDAIA